MTALHDRVRHSAARLRLWSPATRVLAAVSGGSDSVALLFLLRDLAASGHVALAGLAHLDHGIRGQAAIDDAAFCRALAERLGIPALIDRVDVPARAARDGQSIEVAGRLARHAFLDVARTTIGADSVALAHTRDDQAETVLLRLVRGAGPAGLSGIPPLRAGLVRPLLGESRADLQEYLRGIGEPWRDDATNDDRTPPRNRVRHDILPLLRRYFNPRVDLALARAADILRDDEALLARLAQDAGVSILSTVEGRVVIDRAAMAGLPAALARRVALTALETANPARSYGLKEADAVRRIAASDEAGEEMSSVPGVLCERSTGSVVVTPRKKSTGARGLAGAAPGPATATTLRVPGEVTFVDAAWTVVAEGPAPVPSALSVGPHCVVVDAAALSEPLAVRGRRPGDRVQPLGMAGCKKVQDVLVDRKVPSGDRDQVLIVADATGRIVWVAGHVLAHPFRVTARTTAVVILTMRRSSAWRPS